MKWHTLNYNYLKLVILGISSDLDDIISEWPNTFLVLEAVLGITIFASARKSDGAQTMENFPKLRPPLGVSLKFKNGIRLILPDTH